MQKDLKPEKNSNDFKQQICLLSKTQNQLITIIENHQKIVDDGFINKKHILNWKNNQEETSTKSLFYSKLFRIHLNLFKIYLIETRKSCNNVFVMQFFRESTEQFSKTF